MQDIHDIRPPVQFGFDPAIIKIILMVSMAILFLVFLFFMVKKYLKKQKQITDSEYLKKSLAPYDAALKELDLLFQRPVFDPRLFYFDLTAVLRRYIGRSFGINAIEMTSQEFIRSIISLDFDKAIKKDITVFQKHCDPIKYAGIVPKKDQVKQDLSFVKKTISQIEKDLMELKEKQEETF